MGNNKSRLKQAGCCSIRHHKSHREKEDARTEARRAFDAFENLTSTNTLSFDNLKEKFGEELADIIWKHLTLKPYDQPLTFEEFEQRVTPLVDGDTDIIVSGCKDEKQLIRLCSETAGVTISEKDQAFVNLLEKEIRKAESKATWITENAPRFCEGINSLILEKLFGTPIERYDFQSEVLTSLERWFVQSSLPAIYFFMDTSWTPLYNSSEQGFSVNRFDTNILGYHGPTVAAFLLTDDSKFVLATDEDWRESTENFGGMNTTFFQLYPQFIREQNAINAIHCSHSHRRTGEGIQYKNSMKIDEEMSNVKAIEVWGCAGSVCLEEQKTMNERQNQQAENKRKIPFPGKWDDNPDKELMEMAGHTFSNETRKPRKKKETENKENTE